MRASGILMPIFSLPSDYGIGTMGKAAYEFIDFLKNSGQKYWQLLPIGPTSYGDSPYQSFSSFAGNPYFIDFDLLAEDNLLEKSDYENIDFGDNDEKVDYEKWNPNGGAISFGHPNGASGARIGIFCMKELARSGGRYGLFSSCCGGGQGVTTLIENLRR